MAQQALQPGTTQTRGRALFGLLDASGWGWASLKAAVLVHPPDLHARLHPGPGLLLHRQPDDRPRDPRLEPRSTSAPRRNQSLPCPAPVGAVVPWQTSPAEIALPAAADRRRRRPVRDDAPLHRRVRRQDGRRHDVRRRRSRAPATSTSGPTGRTCPSRARTPASIYSGGKIYVVGGRRRGRQADRHGRTSSRPNATTGELGELADVRGGQARPEAARCRWPAPSLLAGTDGLFLIGGTDGTRPVEHGLQVDVRQDRRPEKWTAQPAQLFTPVTDASAAIVGASSGSTAGRWPTGRATGTVQRGEFGVDRQGDDARPVRRPGRRDQPAGAADRHQRLRRQRQPLRGRRQRRHDAAADALLGRPDERRQHPGVEAPRRRATCRRRATPAGPR